ncbi:MAG: hypothetical protein V4613_12430 [Bacteroidota bacterium]
MKQNLKKGVCKLCRKDAFLNFEHVPPRCTFNKKTRYTEVSFEEYMKRKNPLNEKIKGKIKQGGIGFYSFCESCNNFLGNEYVREYKIWAGIAAEILSNGKFNFYNYTVFDQSPNKILKHILSMFVAINEDFFAEAHSDLLEFIKDPLTTELHEKYKIFMYLNTGPEYRYVPYMITGVAKGDIINCTEIAFPPYGYVLTIDSKNNNPLLLNITNFKDYLPNQRYNFDFRIARLQTSLPIPLDYRSYSKIQDDIKNG